MNPPPENVFVLGLDDFNRGKLEALGPPGAYTFHPLLSMPEVTAERDFPLTERLEKAARTVEQAPEGADAIVGYWDFPVSLMLPLLCRRFGLPAPTLESVLRCEHKYWSRLEQREVAPECVPPFAAVDPFSDDPLEGVELDFPFWIKPVKSFASHLGFRIRDRKDFERAVGELRAGIAQVGEPFDRFLALGDLPDVVAGVGGMHCIAEGFISGSQCTLEGFVHGGEVEIYGVVDSIRYRNRSSFSRYEYPSRLPRAVRERMGEVTHRVISRVGLDHSAFNVEFFWEERRDRLWLVEINPRISQSHGDLFEKVDGIPNHRVPVELGLGRRPEWRPGAGPFRRAAKFFLRRREDATVVRTPSTQDVERLAKELPGTAVEVAAEPGMRLSELDPRDQDSYTYIYARLYLGASSQRELAAKYRQAVAALPFEFTPDGEEAVGDGRRRNVFLVGLNDFNRAKVERGRSAAECDYHGLLAEPRDYDLPRYLCEAQEKLSIFDGPVDAIVGYMDFPVSTMLPVLCRRFGVRSPSLESVLQCEHKYWSRLSQKEVVPEQVPAFAAVDPFDDEAVASIPLPYPFWIKPVKSTGSYLGFRVGGRKDLLHAIGRIRAEIGPIAEAFDFVLDQADLPPEIEKVDGRHCIVEELITGRESTLEGWVFGGEVGYHGIVDSVRERNRSTFARYEYPSLLPMRVKDRMVDVGRRVLEHIGFDDSGFNMEFEWDRRRDRIRLVEVNTRVAQHHSDLFEKVDGMTNHEVAIQVALGRRPSVPHRLGEFRRAATCFLRAYEDARVERVPEREALEAIAERYPGTVVQPQVKPGMRLSELFEQDSYSYALAILYLGASDQKALLEKYRSIVSELDFELSS